VVLVGSRSRTPPRVASRLRRCSHRAELAKSSLTSLSRPSAHLASLARCSVPIASDRQDPLPSPPRQRRRPLRIRTPSIVRVLPPPVAQDALALARGITRSPPPVSLLACLGGSRHRDPASGACSLAARRPPRGECASELDPRSFDLGPSAARRLLQPTQSASTSALTARFPSLLVSAMKGARLRASPFVVSSPRAGGTTDLAREAEAPRIPAGGLPVESSPARGGNVFRRSTRRPSRTTLSRARRARYPDPIRSDTSRRETVAAPIGGFSWAVRAAENSTLLDASGGGDVFLTVSPREPCCPTLRREPFGRTAILDLLACARLSRRGPRPPYLREEAWSTPHPRCLPSMSWSPLGRAAPFREPRLLGARKCRRSCIRRRHLG